MIERKITEDRLATLYDAFCPSTRRDDFAFYVPLVMSARAVLDIGCGTGTLLRWAQEARHTGRLCGLDRVGGEQLESTQRQVVEIRSN